MKTKKLLVMCSFVDVYRQLVSEAFRYYDLLLYHCDVDGSERREILLQALHYATRANTVYDCAFYVRINGLHANLLDIQAQCRKYYGGFANSSITMDDIVDEITKELEKGE